VLRTWLLMVKFLFLLPGSESLYKNMDLDLLANISVISFQKYKVI